MKVAVLIRIEIPLSAGEGTQINLNQSSVLLIKGFSGLLTID
jgi:hypothetical protein